MGPWFLLSNDTLILSMEYTIGVDEVGRGPIAGPVVVCACALRTGISLLHLYPKGVLRDSKKLSERQRSSVINGLLPYLKSGDVVFGVGEVEAETIDEIGIVPAIKAAMMQAITLLHEKGVDTSTHIFLDGALSLPEGYSYETIIKGDEKVLEISLASIYAKEYRDKKMRGMASEFPGYGFESHVGYGTAVHYKALKDKGITRLHRKTFLK